MNSWRLITPRWIFPRPNAVRFQILARRPRNRAGQDVGGERVAQLHQNCRPAIIIFTSSPVNEDGVWNETGAVLDITVQPQFWQTGWFRAAAVIFLLGIVAGIVRYISTQKLQREVQLLKQQEAIEQERARIARDLHDQLGANLTQVALLGEMAQEPTKIRPTKSNRTRSKFPTPRARRRVRSMKLSGPSIRPTTRSKAWPITPANTRRNISRSPACSYRADCRRDLPATPIPPRSPPQCFSRVQGSRQQRRQARAGDRRRGFGCA